MRRGQTTVSGTRLRLLALVLALAIFWYAMNPALGPVRRVKKAEEPPDKGRQEAESPARKDCGLDFIDAGRIPPFARPVSVEEGRDADDLEWPEIIYL